MTGVTGIPAPGFADPARRAQRVFRSLLDALARPMSEHPIAGVAGSPLGAGLGAVALTLLDEDCAVWLDPVLSAKAEAMAWLVFHTGARIVTEPADAQFLLLTDGAHLPPLSTLAQGSDQAPHLSATILLASGDGLTGDEPPGAAGYVASGPGIEASRPFLARWAWQGFESEWRQNVAGFPRGVDLILVADDRVAALPRTTRVVALAGADRTGADETGADRTTADGAIEGERACM